METLSSANEHAAIASFARFVLELLAVGAPAELVWETQKGIAEEIRHAELCYGLASAYAGKPIGPRELDIDGGLEQRTDLVAVALGTFHEGCVNETLSTLLACAQRDAARDPAVKSALSTIAGDEAAHAELAWRFVAWACRRSDDARRAIASSLDALTRLGDEADTAEEPGANEALLRAHGRLPRGERREIIERSLAEVVLPCARALLRGSSVDSGLVVTRAASGTPDQA